MIKFEKISNYIIFEKIDSFIQFIGTVITSITGPFTADNTLIRADNNTYTADQTQYTI